MSTDYTINKRGDKEVVITERSARYDLDLYGYPGNESQCFGPQQMSPDEALDAAIGIIYAVWCGNPIETEERIRALSKNIPIAWNKHPTCVTAREEERKARKKEGLAP